MSCSHVAVYKEKEGIQLYETLLGLFISTKLSPPNYQQTWVLCQDCNSYDCRLLCCMHCIYFGCMERHASHHLTNNPDHCLFIEMSNGNIMCFACQDYIYDPEFEEVVRSQLADKVFKYRKDYYDPIREHKLIKMSVGMRGFVNMGDTCYMSSIFQVLLHTPMLRDYFFTDRHLCDYKLTECLYCMAIDIFQRYYSDTCPSNICLNDMLYFFWRNDSNLAGVGQKDAHEFFISTRDLLCKFSSAIKSENRCSCIVHITFQGALQSDLVCLKCLNVSTKIEPLWEISLNILQSQNSSVDLEDCLAHFTRVESLPNIECNFCKTSVEQTKQLSFKYLPLILVIQLKRFKTSFDKEMNPVYSKISISIPFPAELDMTTYITHFRNQIVNSSENGHDTDYTNRYTLYAVIEHRGSMNGGHYVAYIRRTDNVWFECDDIYIRPVTRETVLTIEAYLLFYHKTVLAYE